MQKDKVVVILGPTATGKSHCGIELARRLQGEIISGDSMLVYQKMNIGTAKPSPEELTLVPHHLINILPPDAEYSVADFQKQAGALIREINQRGHLPIVVGGTGFYIQALLEGFQFSQVGPDQIRRQALEKEAGQLGLEVLYKRLVKLDPVTAAIIHPHDQRRIIRALETAMGGDRVSRRTAPDLIYEAAVFGLSMERSALYTRINQRVDQMLADGLGAEVKALLDAGLPADVMSMRSIGYRQLAGYYQGKTTWQEAVQAIKQATRNFAKRQLTWYRHMPYIKWLELTLPVNYEFIVDNMQSALVKKMKLL